MTKHIEGSTSSENSAGNPDDYIPPGSLTGSIGDWQNVVERLAVFASPEKKIDHRLTPPKEAEADLLLNALESTNPNTLSFKQLEEIRRLTNKFQEAAARVLRPVKCGDSEVHFLSAADSVPAAIKLREELTGFPGVDENLGKWTVRDRTDGELLNGTAYPTLKEAWNTITGSLKAQGYRIEDGIIEEVSTATNPK